MRGSVGGAGRGSARTLSSSAAGRKEGEEGSETNLLLFPPLSLPVPSPAAPPSPSISSACAAKLLTVAIAGLAVLVLSAMGEAFLLEGEGRGWEEDRVVEFERIEGALIVDEPEELTGRTGVGKGGAAGAGRGFLSFGMTR